MAEVNGVMMQFFHWYTSDDGSLWNELKDRASQLAEVGITSVWLPPAYKGFLGASDVGYAVYDLFDLGEFDQRGSVRTKYGTKQELVEAVKAAHDVGLQVYADVVINHKMGGDAEEEFFVTPVSQDNRHQVLGESRKIKAHTRYTFPGRQCAYSEMQWSFEHFTAVDVDNNDPDHEAVFLIDGKTFDTNVDIERGSYDYLMGCDLDVKHSQVREELNRWGEWYFDTVGMDGVRFDAVKHVEAGFFPEWLNHVRAYSNRKVFAVGEYWSYDVSALHHFISLTGGDVALFDAPLHRNFSVASKAGAEYDLQTIFHNTVVKDAPELAVTLVSNHDTQPLQALESVVEPWFTPLAYALILLRRDGYPCIFYADYYGASYADLGHDGQTQEITIPSHRFLIDKFLEVRRRFAFGDQIDYFDHPNVIGWTRLGTEERPGGMAVVIGNGDVGTKTMEVQMANRTYRDITDHVKDHVTTDEHGWGAFRCNARSVSVWVPV